MAKKSVDGIIESVRYKADGQVDWVRAYLRRGKIYSDWVLIDRNKLIQELKAGKDFQAGKRQKYKGGTFDLTGAVTVVQANGKEILVTGNRQASQDDLAGVPTI